MDEPLLRLIASICAVPGVLMLLFPSRVPRIEEFLNRDWGHRQLFAIRSGLPAEQQAEQLLNTRVLSRSVVWDGMLRRHPRATGLALSCTGVLFWLAA